MTETYENKTCFIITPIGPENSDIRRKANGLIDSVILPVLKDNLNFKEENIHIPHRTYNTGSITKQVIENIINDDLAIANLTGLNPNVMYELAVRHAKRLPVVTLMENGTNLPFDIADERTLFYENDIANVSNLKPKLKKTITSAMKDDKPDNPIYRVLTENKIFSDIQKESPDAYIMKRLAKIENMIAKNSNLRIGNSKSLNYIKVKFMHDNNFDQNVQSEFIDSLLSLKNIEHVSITDISSNYAEANIGTKSDINFDQIVSKIKYNIESMGFKFRIISEN